MKQKFLALTSNLRFYVLLSSVLLSLVLMGILQSIVPGEQLYYIRLGQYFGLLAIVYWYVSLILSPLSKLVGKKPWMSSLLFARRALGVSAAYFAVLHVLVAINKQMGGFSGLFGLPGRFTFALLLGGIGLFMLLAMAATSFDFVVKRMTYPRWKWLQRTGYGAGVLVIVHIWMIGTHSDYLSWQLGAYVALVILFGLEAIRISKQLAQRYSELAPKDIIGTITISIWIVLSGLLLVLPQLVQRNHSEGHTQSSSKETRHE